MEHSVKKAELSAGLTENDTVSDTQDTPVFDVLVRYDAPADEIFRELSQQPQSQLDLIRADIRKMRESDMPTSEISKHIIERAESFRPSPEEFREILDFRAKFYQYSLHNNLLIQMRNPYSSYVGSYSPCFYEIKCYGLPVGIVAVHLLFQHGKKRKYQ